MSTEQFYAKLPRLKEFIEITQPHNFVDLPHDWHVVITDIVGSTQAIEAGRYKDVNLLGACSIVAVLNVAKSDEIPFVFGGDGASILIPPALLEQTKQALLATQQAAKTRFDLDLRVGLVPVTDVLAAGFEIKVAKLQVSENYSQGIFTGGGLTCATEMVKQDIPNNPYQLKPSTQPLQPDFSGLECRWQDIPNQRGEVLSILVLAMGSKKEQYLTYRTVIQKIQEIFGEDADLHPVAAKSLQLSFQHSNLLPEAKARATSQAWLPQQMYLLKEKLENFLGRSFMKFETKVGDVDWGAYKQIVTAATDYRKFDDMLRMVIAGTADQREQLNSYLEAQYKAGKLVHGIHLSDRALMTCLVFERNGQQVHFIDGADGGYALAAKAMKARLQRKAANWSAYVKMMKLRKVNQRQSGSSLEFHTDDRFNLPVPDALPRHSPQALQTLLRRHRVDQR
ncbi:MULTISPECIES: DUF3095 domain-containing protein [Trichocoleus]|uniref:DUF3095 domain-containing protein n=1 Tax=Trichocoleus desertorum GB2-A4 TaxID=2933944 RepID=A0ABV0J4R1_9CYAN|nr:DUF3095 domain-containing protein [Trichocoleus sp. FACHB-46]MBD1863601.1 DUF3095 domain-containing protein [Trichocoleus sp. FACHB-46]